jgi:hypothetical protein
LYHFTVILHFAAMGGLDGVITLIAGSAYGDRTCRFSMRRPPIHSVRALWLHAPLIGLLSKTAEI